MFNINNLINNKMGTFDNKKSDFEKSPSIDLSDFRFISDDHIRMENGRITSGNNKGAYRGIRMKTSDNKTFNVTIYNINENHPVWGDNIQMAEKRMRIVQNDKEKIVFRGFGSDKMGVSFEDYGLTLHKSNNDISKITLHLFDRKIDITYKKANNEVKTDELNQYSDFDDFKIFAYNWDHNMPMDEKIKIAMDSDSIHNIGFAAYNKGDLTTAIHYFELSLDVMPNNDDAIRNLIICYKEIGNYSKAKEMQRKLDYLS